MKMGDGGFRPAYNVQYAVAGSEMGGHRTIVGVNVTNVGSDMGSLAPMVEQIAERTGHLPTVLLADGGHAKFQDIVETRRMGVRVLVPASKTAAPIDKLKQDLGHPGIIAWREDMETDEAKRAIPRPRWSVRTCERASEVTSWRYTVSCNRIGKSDLRNPNERDCQQHLAARSAAAFLIFSRPS